ncbi:unnamed protein product [Acanthoscelides obtectus]|uniref:MADF domain-containing protein n=1 Tax=Acanthoscelides obtectus TaxID=200917 RepID=A0A9P0KJV1_ACAOB|nr:unnamed protein product [Acanthoscelides obtectus]CAK1640946.1 hypothetical protein AOBTE_LOCUS12034 [Acanthoscelides obtectus]
MPKLSAKINKFVQMYGEEECLWNATIPSYKDKSICDSALQKISGKLLELGLEMSIKDIKMKIKNLRTTYRQKLSKIEKSTRSGAGSKDEYKSKLNWFDEMHSFIKCVPMKRKTTDSQESAIDEEQDNNQMSQANIENSKENNIDISNDNSDNSEDVANSENFSPRPSTSATGNIP